MNLKEIDRIVGSIQSHLFRNSNSFSVGMLKSHFKGAGLQFKEHQVYNPGDDVRFIDWKLSAKTNTTFLKTFEEERNVEIYILMDLSESMLYGYKGTSKAQVVLEIACLLFLLADKSKDKVGIILLNDDTPKLLPLMSGHEGIANLISQLEKMNLLNEKGAINIADYQPKLIDEKKTIGLLKSLIARGKEVVLLSDLTNLSASGDLQKLLQRRNMHCFKIMAPLDEAKKNPFAVFGKKAGRGKLSRTKSMPDKTKIRGRVKSIHVEDRYLESFVREML